MLTERDLFRWLPAEGFAVASIDYRLSGEARWPACIDDVKDATTWLIEHQSDLGLDAGRLALWGESAGGYLAVTAGLSLAAEGRKIAGIVDWYGPVDFLTMAVRARRGPTTPTPRSRSCSVDRSRLCPSSPASPAL